MGRETKQQLRALKDFIGSLAENQSDLRRRLVVLERSRPYAASEPKPTPIYTPIEVLKCHLRALKSGEMFEQSWSEDHVAPALEALLAEHEAASDLIRKYGWQGRDIDDLRAFLFAHNRAEGSHARP